MENLKKREKNKANKYHQHSGKKNKKKSNK